MSVSEDIELRDLVVQALDKNGTLAKIRAELRASVFLALEEQSSELRQPIGNDTLSEFLNEADSALSLCLVREFLEYLKLDYTLAVFNAETTYGKDYQYKGRNGLMKDLNLEKFSDKKSPLLTLVIQSALEVLRSSSITSKVKEGEAGDFDANTTRSPKTGVPSNFSFAESSISSSDHSHTPFNQTFTTGALVTSFGSPDSSPDKVTAEAVYQNFQSKNQATNAKKSQSGQGDIDAVSTSKGVGENPEHKQKEIRDSTQQTKDRTVHSTSTNPQTSLSNLPPLNDYRTNKNPVTDPKGLFNALMGVDSQDNYEEDFSSESSGAGDKEEKGMSGINDKKKEADLSQEHVSSKDVNSPVASVSEELEGDTNSVTDEVLNSAASADTADSSMSYIGAKTADYMENI